MNRHDEQLAALLQDAVADVEPQDRLSELHGLTASAPTARRWWLAAGGSALAVAAAVTAIAVLGNDPAPTVVPDPIQQPTEQPTGQPTPSPEPTEPAEPTGQTGQAVAAYFVGETPRGPRLYREFQPVDSPTPGLAGLALLESGPDDPDYTSEWPAGSFELDRISDPEAGIVHVFLADSAPADPSDLALQQVVYTVRAGLQEPLSVVFHRGETQTDPVTAAPQLDVLSLVNLSDPVEGQAVAGTLDVRGAANSNEANVLWSLESADGSAGMGGNFTATGWMDTRLFPFEGEIDVSSLEPGTYTLKVETDDPSGGAEGFGAFTDTRTIVIE